MPPSGYPSASSGQVNRSGRSAPCCCVMSLPFHFLVLLYHCVFFSKLLPSNKYRLKTHVRYDTLLVVIRLDGITYVGVLPATNEDGTLRVSTQGDIIPACILFGDKAYRIDRIISAKRDASPRLGAVGISYIVMIRGQLRTLFHRAKPAPAVWIVEKQDGPPRKVRHCCADLQTPRK